MFRFYSLLLLILGALVSLTEAEYTAAPLFCKCTCARNSTLIPLGKQASCTQCTHAFCLSQGLPICKGTAENDVLSTCIQRDSRKDQIIVWGFILGTAGLLAWAAAKRLNELREGRKKNAANAAAAAVAGGLGSNARDRGPYMPVGSNARV
ncbi:hypothetical protein F5Y14DRAFT_399412 [Nemania sp. NC0429]|nr:hypothetical protein F5Y14DRAFT_399412 [Nemania sp. NC0429]